MTDETVIEEEAISPEEVETEQEGVAESENAETETEEVEAESSPEEDSKEDEKKGIQKRIDELTRYRREAEREAAYWRELATKQPEPEPVNEKTLKDFDYDEMEYQKYLFSEAKRQAVEEAKRALSDDFRNNAERARLASFESIEKEYVKQYPDYMEVTRNPDVTYTQSMHQIVMEMDSGPDVTYFLCKNPEVAEKIARLSPQRQAIELGRIEERLISQKSQKPVVSNAPKPASTIKAKSSQTISVDSPESDKLSIEEWVKRRNKQLHR